MISTDNYQFLILLNVIIFAATGFIGISSLYQATKIVLEQDDEEYKDTPENMYNFGYFYTLL